MTPIHTGGCQCGAVRFRVEGEVTDVSICHCRMCQKAFGSYYAPLASVRGLKLVWTKREPSRFASSNLVQRGFCERCGTPLTYEAPDGIAIAVGAFDRPDLLKPDREYGREAKMPFFAEICSLTGTRTEDDLNETSFLGEIVSYQHPDHD